MDVKQRFSKSIKSSVGSGSFVVEFSMAVAVQSIEPVEVE